MVLMANNFKTYLRKQDQKENYVNLTFLDLGKREKMLQSFLSY